MKIMSSDKDFNKKEYYSRKEISEILGGSYQCALPHKNGEVVAGCYDPKMNPNAPAEVLVGKGRDKEKYSRKLAEEKSVVPIFLKRASARYEFMGKYRATKYSTDIQEIKDKNKSNRNSDDIAAVLYYEKDETS